MDKNFYKFLFAKFKEKRELLYHSIDKIIEDKSIAEDERVERAYLLFHKIAQEELSLEAASEYYHRQINLEMLKSKNKDKKEK